MPKRRNSSSLRHEVFGTRMRRAGAIAAILLLVPLALILLLRFAAPPGSALMLQRKLSGTTIRYQWVPLDHISRKLVETVVTSEDSRFCAHWGVDWDAVEDAIEEAEERGDLAPRGASTIPMQTAKNLFLWEGRSYLRKAIEVPLAYTMSVLWPKRRMIEMYLNIAEWGPGVFGAEAAARYHFRRSAAKLTARQAAQLAAALPNPHVRNAGRPGPKTLRLARHIERRMRRENVPVGCIYPGG
jgi:monofunctional biosynthetic peptidoglycan transglycosylase